MNAQPPLRFRVYGDPLPKGSLIPAMDKAGRMFTRPDNPDVQTWQEEVRQAAALAMLGRPQYAKHEPLCVRIVFLIARRKSYPKKILIPFARPDIDKIARGCLDAMQGVVYPEDGAVATLMLRKRFAHGEPGALITVEPDRL